MCLFFAVWAGERVLFFAVWAGGVFLFLAVWAGVVFLFLLFGPGACFFVCCLGRGACSFFCCLGGGFFFCCLGREHVFFLLFGRGTGVHSLTGLLGSSLSDPTTKKTKQQKTTTRVPPISPGYAPLVQGCEEF